MLTLKTHSILLWNSIKYTVTTDYKKKKKRKANEGKVDIILMTIPCLLLAIENDLPVAELTFVLCYFYESGILSPRGLSFSSNIIFV